MPFGQTFRRLLRAETGVSAIEFAILAPTLMLLVFGIIEYSLIMMVYNVMESSTSTSSRLGKTGFSGEGVTREQTILTSIEARAGAVINAEELTVTSKFYEQYDQINDPEPFIDSNSDGNHDAGESYTDINGNAQWDADMGASGYGSSGDVVVYQVSYPWHISTPIMREIFGDADGIFNITTHAVVKNEPY